MPTLLNLGSLNVDHVYQVPHFVAPGETLSATSFATGAGGKGFNQSIALARAGVHVAQMGCLGREAAWLRDKLASEGVDLSRLTLVPSAPGHAMIQVNPSGQNAIVLFAGANHALTADALPMCFQGLSAEDWFLTQNETSCVPEALHHARSLGMTVCFNPAPMDAVVLEYPLDALDYLIVNETEGAVLTDCDEPQAILAALRQRCPRAHIILTLGAEGVCCAPPLGEVVHASACPVKAVDTTAAGDTFIGYFIAARMRHLSLESALQHGCRAAALSVTRPGAADSIPFLHELDNLSSALDPTVPVAPPLGR